MPFGVALTCPQGWSRSASNVLQSERKKERFGIANRCSSATADKGIISILLAKFSFSLPHTTWGFCWGRFFAYAITFHNNDFNALYHIVLAASYQSSRSGLFPPTLWACAVCLLKSIFISRIEQAHGVSPTSYPDNGASQTRLLCDVA